MRTLRTPLWVRWTTAALALLFAGLAVVAWYWQGWALLSLAPAGLALASAAVCLQSWRARVCLAPGELVYTRHYRAVRLVSNQIREVLVRRGVGVGLRLEGGQTIYLPDVAAGNDELAEELRRWLAVETP